MSDGEEQDDAQKTEEPTQKKIMDARKKGQVPLSREVNNWMMLLMATILIATTAGSMFTQLKEVLVLFIAQSHNLPSLPGGAGEILGQTLLDVLRIMTLPFLALMFAAFAGPFLQVGPMLALESIKPALSKISIIKGFGRLFSMRSIVEFLKGIMKLAIVSIVGFLIISPFYASIELSVGMPTMFILEQIHHLVVKMLIGIIVVLLVVAFIDLVYQRSEDHKKLRMTKQEVKDEYKQAEGDPHVKGRLRQLRMERARQRMMQSVPEADVIITNPTHYSIALKYKPGEMEAPLCLAKGVDEVAMRIREVAKEHDITLYENRPLARALYDTVEIDQTIPTEHYQAVAEVISYVFKLKGQTTR